MPCRDEDEVRQKAKRARTGRATKKMVTEAGGAHGERHCSRPLRSECHRGAFAGSQVFHRDIAVWISALEEFSGRDRHGFDVAVGARLAVDRDFELPLV